MSSWRWACWCSKHVEDYNVTYILLINKEFCIKVGKWNKFMLQNFTTEIPKDFYWSKEYSVKNKYSCLNEGLCINFIFFPTFILTRLFREIHRNSRLCVYLDPWNSVPRIRNCTVTLNSSLRPYCRAIRLKLEILTYVNRSSTGKFKGFRAKMSAFVTFDSPCCFSVCVFIYKSNTNIQIFILLDCNYCKWNPMISV